MPTSRPLAVACLLVCLLSAAPARAQEKPFAFSITTAPEVTRPQARVDYEVGAGENAFRGDDAYQPEQRFNVQASIGRITLLGRVGLTSDGSAYQSSQSGEMLVTMTPRGSRISLAAGGGALHEAGGANVLVSRVVVGSAGDAWMSQGNVIFQHAFAADRDPLDLLFTGGVSRRIASNAAVGVEAVAEDLEGFWDAAEAEGGARLLVGPSLHLSWASGKWQLLCAGGPMLHPRPTDRSSDAVRDLPPTPRRVGYAAQVGLSVTLGR